MVSSGRLSSKLSSNGEYLQRLFEKPLKAQAKVFYEPEMQLLTIFWHPPRKEQIITESGDGVILIKDETTGEPIGIEVLSYHPGDNRFDAVNVELSNLSPVL